MYLTEIGIKDKWIGILLTCIMIGDLFITMYLTTNADKIGRKKVLALGSMLEIFTGIIFSLSSNFYMLMISGIFGVISLSGGDVGPFLSI
jgi:predicted MFS family arabinose efflux permease